MNLPLPRNAWEIVKARQSGMKPAGPLIVVATDRYEQLADDAHVYVEPEKSYRWDWVKGLDHVVIVIDAQSRLGSIVADIEAAEPKQTDVIDVERRLGWQVIAANPGRPIRTVTWPRHWVEKWLTLNCGPVPFSSV